MPTPHHVFPFRLQLLIEDRYHRWMGCEVKREILKVPFIRQKCNKLQKNRIMEIRRDIHLKRIVARKGNGMIKVITEIRRCGKS